MSTSDPPNAGLPQELVLLQGNAPKPGDAPSTHAPTPGISLGAARMPGGPTLPDYDASFGTVLARLANELFSPLHAPSAEVGSAGVEPTSPPFQRPNGAQDLAIVTSPLASSSALAPPSTSTAHDVADPQRHGPPSTTLEPAVRSPFDAPLDFGVLREPSLPAFSLPLLETASPTPPSADTTPEPAAPYWAPTAALAEAPVSRGPAPALDTLPFDLDPTRAVVLAPPHETASAERRESTSNSATPAATLFDPVAIRREFPILEERVNGKRLVWLDNAATTQKPRAVIDRLSYYYEHENSNIHRAAHTLAARASDAYESARESVRRFVNAPSKNEIVFVRGTTEGINFVANSWAKRHVAAGDEIVISWLEHHANIVPWQMLAREVGATLRVAPVDDRGQVLLDEYQKLLSPKTRLVAFSQVSNALGTVTPAREMIELAHRYGARVLLDGAQAVSHMRIDVQALDCDFFVFSGHKVFGPTGIGAVYGKPDVLAETPPWQGGGNMIRDVTFERTVFQDPPARFEAGTGNIGDAIGLGAALDWLSRIGVENVGRYEHELLEYGTERLLAIPGLRMIGTAPGKAGVLSFVVDGIKTEEASGLLDQDGIAVRSGHHCAQPILRRFGVEATIRASLAPYNTREDLDVLVDAITRLRASAR